MKYIKNPRLSNPEDIYYQGGCTWGIDLDGKRYYKIEKPPYVQTAKDTLLKGLYGIYGFIYCIGILCVIAGFMGAFCAYNFNPKDEGAGLTLGYIMLLGFLVCGIMDVLSWLNARMFPSKEKQRYCRLPKSEFDPNRDIRLVELSKNLKTIKPFTKIIVKLI